MVFFCYLVPYWMCRGVLENFGYLDITDSSFYRLVISLVGKLEQEKIVSQYLQSMEVITVYKMKIGFTKSRLGIFTDKYPRGFFLGILIEGIFPQFRYFLHSVVRFPHLGSNLSSVYNFSCCHSST